MWKWALGVGLGIGALAAMGGSKKKAPGMSSVQVDYRRGDVFFLNGPTEEEKARFPEREGCGIGIMMNGHFHCDAPFLEFDLNKKGDTKDVIDLYLTRAREADRYGHFQASRHNLERLAQASMKHGLIERAKKISDALKSELCCLEDGTEKMIAEIMSDMPED